jgi:hypothetical protein
LCIRIMNPGCVSGERSRPVCLLSQQICNRCLVSMQLQYYTKYSIYTLLRRAISYQHLRPYD